MNDNVTRKREDKSLPRTHNRRAGREQGEQSGLESKVGIRDQTSEGLYHNLFESANDPIFIMKQDTFLLCNPKTVEIFRCKKEDIIGRKPYELSPSTQPDGRDSKEKALEIIATALSGRKLIFEWRHSRCDGTIFDAEVSLSPVTLPTGVFLHAIVRDLTERKRAEELLRYSEQRLRSLIEHTMDSIFCYEYSPPIPTDIPIEEQLDMLYDGILVECNEICARSYGAQSIGEVLGRKLVDNFGTGRGSVDALFRDFIAGGYKMINGEGETVLPDGTKRYYLNNAHGIIENGKIVRIWGIYRDITDRKRAEDALSRAMKELEILKNRLQEENIYLREEIKLEHNFEEIIGESRILKKVLHDIEVAAKVDSTVLILGETGTGKELVARAIHNLSERKAHPLVKVNCAALPAHIIESELFGHEKGAFTGAIAMRKGRFELAHGGSIFLDEISELSSPVQAKLLRIIQEGEFERVGSEKTMKVDVRIIAATNRDLKQMVLDDKFRRDLYYRLNVFPITVPPLRERREDIPSLVKHFVQKYSKKCGKQFDRISKEAMDTLQSLDWPGNIRELENVIERAVIFCQGPTLEIDRSKALSLEDGDIQLNSLEDMERQYIRRVLERTNWIVEGENGAAKVLAMHPNTLRSRMKKLDIHKPAR